MRKLIIALAVLALLAVTVYAATPLCSSEKDCNTKQTIFGTPKYCDTTDDTCKDKAAKNKGDSVDNKSFCKDLTKDGSDKCRPFGTKGCKAGDVVCLGSVRDTTCNFPEDKTEKGQVAEGDRCEPNSNKGSEKCKEGEDLFCHKTYKICVKLPGPGEPCLDGECQVNAGCNFGMCVPIGSIGDGQFSASNTLCESGLAENDRCKPTYARSNYRQQCQANSDCQSDELCDMERGDKEGWGFCVGVQQHILPELLTCQGQRCVGDENNKNCATDASKCQHAAVKAICSLFCSTHPSDWADLSSWKALFFPSDEYAHSFDCSTLTATPLEDNKCDLKPQDVIKNCDAVFNNFRQSSASNLSSNVVALIAAAAAVVALVF